MTRVHENVSSFSIYQIIKKFPAGSDASSSVIQGSAVYLIDLFRNCTMIGAKHRLELRRTFGIYPESAMSKILSLVKTLIETLTYEAQEDFIEHGFPNNEGLMDEAFGSKIKFAGQTPLDDSYYLVPFKEVFDAKEDAFKSLSFKFEAVPKEIIVEPEIVKKPVPTRTRYDQEWLEKALRNSMNSDSCFSSTELTLSVVQLLKSRSIEQLQAEV